MHVPTGIEVLEDFLRNRKSNAKQETRDKPPLIFKNGGRLSTYLLLF